MTKIPTVTITGKWLVNLLEQIENYDYCFVCNNHPSHGHDPECPFHLPSEDNE